MDSGGRFEILEPLGAGTLGRLYRARDGRLGRSVALRVVAPAIAADPSARETLLADARKAASLSHPHLAALLDIVVVRHAHEILCLVHELVEGQPLSALLRDGRMQPQLALEVAAQVAEGLAAATEVGLVHGALDPDAILVSTGGQATLLDFGVSRWTAGAAARAAAALTLDGRESPPAEKPSALYYASPEELLGSRVDGRSDVFALGAILHEMLTGKPAFSGETEGALFLQILSANPAAPSRLNPGVPQAADAIVRRALAKSLQHRYATAAALAGDLRHLLAAPGVPAVTTALSAADELPLVAHLEPIAEVPAATDLSPIVDAPSVADLLPIAGMPTAADVSPVVEVPGMADVSEAELAPVTDLPSVTDHLPAHDLPPVTELPPVADLLPIAELFSGSDRSPEDGAPDLADAPPSLLSPIPRAPAEPASPLGSLFEPRREPPRSQEPQFTGFFDRPLQFADDVDDGKGTDAMGAVAEQRSAARPIAPMPAEAPTEGASEENEIAPLTDRLRRPPTPQTTGTRSRPAVRPAVWGMVAAAAVIVLLAGVAWFGRNALDLPWQDRVTAAARPYVMVTSFAVAGDSAPPYFGPGFAEDLAARLSEVPGAIVVGRASVRDAPFASDWRARAKRAGASFLVRGTIKPGPYALHADVDLLDAASGANVWSQHFSREPRQIAALQAEIAGQLAQRLRLLTPTSNRWTRAAVRKTDPAAYDLYLQGREAAEKRDRTRAISLYDQALQRDPGLVEARAALSQALYLEEYYAGGTRDSASSGRALREAEAALAVDAELPAAHLAAALAAPTITMAASSLARVLAFDPSNGEAWHHAGDLMSEIDPPSSVPFYRASLALEPSIDANWRDLASAYASAGNAEGARDAIARGEAARPDRPWWKEMRARLDVEQGHYDSAIQALGTDPAVESAPIVWLMGRVIPLAMANRVPDARREAARLVERYPAYCEGGAVLGAVERDGPAVAEQGRQRASAILAAASRPDADPSMKVCAALAAAGTGDPAEAASWMSRVAGDERALRLWTRQAVFGPALSFRLRWYPWNKVAASQPMQVASSQLEASLKNIREEVERRLPTPPGPTRAER